jgi:hypothetical protein
MNPRVAAGGRSAGSSSPTGVEQFYSDCVTIQGPDGWETHGSPPAGAAAEGTSWNRGDSGRPGHTGRYTMNARSPEEASSPSLPQREADQREHSSDGARHDEPELGPDDTAELRRDDSAKPGRRAHGRARRRFITY